jgi:hypothetical protein
MVEQRKAEIREEIEQEIAVTKIQSLHRGKIQRQELAKKKTVAVGADMLALDSSDEDDDEDDDEDVMMAALASEMGTSAPVGLLEVANTSVAAPEPAPKLEPAAAAEPEPKEAAKKPARKMSKMGSLLLNAHRGGDLEKAVEDMEEALETEDAVEAKASLPAGDSAEDEFTAMGSALAAGDESTPPNDAEDEFLPLGLAMAGGDESTPPQANKGAGADDALDAAVAVFATSDVSSSDGEFSEEEIAVRNEARSELSEIRKVVQESGGGNIDTDKLTQDEAAEEAAKKLAEMTAGLNTSSDEEDGFEAHPALEGTEEDAREALREELSKLESDIAMV